MRQIKMLSVKLKAFKESEQLLSSGHHELKVYRKVSYLMGCGTNRRKDNFIADTFLTPRDWKREISVTARILFQIFIKLDPVV